MTIGIDGRPLMDKNYSGVSLYTLNILRAILNLDQKNKYLIFYNSAKKPSLPKFNQPNVEYRGFGYSNKLFNFSINYFNRPLVDKLIGGVDTFFVPNFHFISWSKSCRKILAVHDLSFLLYSEFFSRKMRYWHYFVLRKNIIKEADVILASSYNTKADLIDLFKVPEEKIKVCYLGVEDRFFKRVEENERDRVRKKYGLPEKYFLFLSSLEPRKNLSGVIQAMEKNNIDTPLVVAGGSGWNNKDLIQKIKKNGKIKLVGYVDEDDKPALYQMAEFFIYPSFYEGFSLPILEAMAGGTPVICGNNSAQIEVGGKAAILVDPYNISDIGSAISVLSKDKKLRERLSELSIGQAKKFPWSKTAQIFLNSL